MNCVASLSVAVEDIDIQSDRSLFRQLVGVRHCEGKDRRDQVGTLASSTLNIFATVHCNQRTYFVRNFERM